MSAGFSLPPSETRAAPPQRIVSLNVCTDQILIELVPRRRISAVTTLAFDPTLTADPQAFDAIAATQGGAEDVLARDPDLIIAGTYTTSTTVDLLRRLGRRVVVVQMPESLAGVRAVIAEIAAAVEEPAAGARLISVLDARVARVRDAVPVGGVRPRALVYQINNYAVGPGTLVAEALEISGLRNGADAIRFSASGQITLEQLIAAPPDLVVLATAVGDTRTPVADNLNHPALAQLLQRTPHIVLPWPLWLCGTQHIATAIEQLAAARAALVTPAAVMR